MEFTKVGEGKLNKSSLSRKDGAKLNHTKMCPHKLLAIHLSLSSVHP